nr:glycoside hydrolase family 3 N-terminal domain-containing protein [Actinomyces sp.]
MTSHETPTPSQQAPTFYRQDEGPTLGTCGAPVIKVDGHLFKDLARTGELLPYEDWRLSASERAADLAGRLSIEQIAGLMLYSPHQAVPNPGHGPFPGTYGGRSLAEAGADPWSLTDQQTRMLTRDHIRHVLAITLESADTAARWNNALQALAESTPLGVPVSIATDPRHGAGQATGAEFATSAVDVSRWPEGMGMAALFDPRRAREYAEVISQEYRALGITTALGPQIDLGTEPRWMRLQDTWGPSPLLVTDYVRAVCDAMQTTPAPDQQQGAAFGPAVREPSYADAGWGQASVSTMVKHWPGGGTGEAGRDAHYGFGKFAVYPGGNEAEHLLPFTHGAFDLNGPTASASAVMPYYTISSGYRTPDGQVLNTGGDGRPRANAYHRVIVHDMLRQRYGFDGVVCTDWGITADPDPEMSSFGQRCYGVEELSVVERHVLAIDNGVDQLGGNSEAAAVLEAYRVLVERDGEAAARARFEASAVRLLRVFFRTGLFDNPYLDPAASAATVGCEAFVQAGLAAQRDSLVLLKNKGADGLAPLPLAPSVTRVWVPRRHIDQRLGFMRLPEPACDTDPYQPSRAALERVEDPAQAQAAVVFIESPLCESYSVADREAGGNGYLPISLQWGPYTAEAAREHSLACGDFRETAHPDRSVRGKQAQVANAGDLELVRQARAQMGERPVVVVLRMRNPVVMAELEPLADALVIDFGVQQEVVWELLRGRAAPRGLLPLTLPASMEVVERHDEDRPFDYAAYEDGAGHTYRFGFGLDWKGVIHDERVERYAAVSA